MTTTLTTVRVEPAYDDPNLLWDLATANAPYPAPTSGFNDPPQASKLPWFKAVWAPAESAVDGVGEILHNPRFIEAARTAASAQVVRPRQVLANFMGPMPALPPHLDPSTFRGQESWITPGPDTGAQAGSQFAGARTLAGLMSTSGLFERWRVCSVTAVTWYYPGATGEYRYWPNGSDGPAVVERPPFGNVALVGDNNTVFHGIGDVGRPDQYLRSGTITRRSKLSYTGEGWAITDDDGVRVEYGRDDVRISVVWKADCFRDDADAALFDDHTDDLGVEQVVSVFADDLRRRGVSFDEPTEPLADRSWFRTLILTYGFAKPPMSSSP